MPTLPTCVRNVLYRHGHETCPAMVIGPDSDTTIALVAFSPTGGVMFKAGVAEDPRGQEPCTWSWPTIQRKADSDLLGGRLPGLPPQLA